MSHDIIKLSYRRLVSPECITGIKILDFCRRLGVTSAWLPGNRLTVELAGRVRVTYYHNYNNYYYHNYNYHSSNNDNNHHNYHDYTYNNDRES